MTGRSTGSRSTSRNDGLPSTFLEASDLVGMRRIQQQQADHVLRVAVNVHPNEQTAERVADEHVGGILASILEQRA
jgi:hypothetical protein